MRNRARLHSSLELNRPNCIICGEVTDNVPPLWAIVSPWIREIGATKKRLSTLFRCGACGAGWFEVRYDEHGMNNLYSNYRGANYVRIRERWEPWYTKEYNDQHDSKWWIQQRAKQIIDFLQLPNLSSYHIIDIGGDTGAIAQAMEPASFEVVELSTSRVTSLDLAQKGIETIALCSHVLEHVADPRAFLRTSLEQCKMLYIEVPHGVPVETKARKSLGVLFAALLSSFFPAWWSKLGGPAAGRKPQGQTLRQSEHLTFFSEQTIKKLAEELNSVGYRVRFSTAQILGPDKKPVKILQCLFSAQE